MPNWVKNVLTITGESEVVQRFKHQAVGRRHVSSTDEPANAFNFHSLVPVPEAIIQANYDPVRYDWEIANWGCKWGADYNELKEDHGHKLVYWFETPNSPPHALLKRLGRLWPELRFEDSYFEPINHRFCWLLKVQGDAYEHRPANMAEALACWREDAEQGSARAQYCLGVCYHEGLGVAVDKAEALRWFRLAADQRYAPASNALVK